jgi:hypothetical protein
MNDWVWLAALLASNGLMFVSCRLRYKFGVWDGAFNQFLPRVQDAMREYDPHRASQILDRT